MYKIRQVLFSFLLLFSFPSHLQASPLLGQMATATQHSLLSSVSLQDIQQLIYEYPKLSLVIAAFISFVSYSKLFLSQHKKKGNENSYPKTEIFYTNNSTTPMLKIFTPDQTEPYCCNNLHSYETDPTGNLILIRKLNETPILSVISSNILAGMGAYTFIENLLRCSTLYLVVDKKTGSIIIKLPNAQQCNFSKNGKYLLVREAKSKNIFMRLRNRFKTAESLPLKTDFSLIQYKIIDLTTKKIVYTIDNVFSAMFCDEDTLQIIDITGERKYFKPFPISNFFSTYTQFVEVNDKNNPTSTIITKFYFNSATETYCLDIEKEKKQLYTFDCVKTYTQYKDYLLVNTNPHEYKKLQDLLHNITFTSFIGTLQAIISVLQKPQFNAILLNTAEEAIDEEFHYINPLICSFTNRDTIFTAINPPQNDTDQNNSVIYQEFDLINHTKSIYQNGRAITFTADNPYIVIDEHNKQCQCEQNTVHALKKNIEEIGILIEKTVTETIRPLFTHKPPKTSPSPTKLSPDQSRLTLHRAGKFHVKRSNICKKSKTDYLEFLQKGIHAFQWNMYIYDGLKILEDHIASKGHICISHQHPENMDWWKVLTYQSLTGELKKVINYMKEENTNSIISIFLTSNDCPANTIEQEINAVIKEKKYNDLLLTPSLLEVYGKKLADITVEDMMANNNRLLLFCDKETSLTHPTTAVSTCITYI